MRMASLFRRDSNYVKGRHRREDLESGEASGLPEAAQGQ